MLFLTFPPPTVSVVNVWKCKIRRNILCMAGTLLTSVWDKWVRLDNYHKVIQLLGFMWMVAQIIQGGKMLRAEVCFWGWFVSGCCRGCKACEHLAEGSFPAPAHGHTLCFHTQWVKCCKDAVQLPTEAVLQSPMLLQESESCCCIHTSFLSAVCRRCGNALRQ